VTAQNSVRRKNTSRDRKRVCQLDRLSYYNVQPGRNRVDRAFTVRWDSQLESLKMAYEAKTVVALPASGRARVRTHRSAQLMRATARELPPRVVPLFGARPSLRERSQAGVGLAIAFGFSALCWAGLAAVIF